MESAYSNVEVEGGVNVGTLGFRVECVIVGVLELGISWVSSDEVGVAPLLGC